LAQGICLPKFENMKLSISIGPHEFISDKPRVQKKEGFARWDKREIVTIQDKYENVNRFPTLYVKLLNQDNKQLCYFRGSLSDFTN